MPLQWCIQIWQSLVEGARKRCSECAETYVISLVHKHYVKFSSANNQYMMCMQKPTFISSVHYNYCMKCMQRPIFISSVHNYFMKCTQRPTKNKNWSMQKPTFISSVHYNYYMRCMKRPIFMSSAHYNYYMKCT